MPSAEMAAITEMMRQARGAPNLSAPASVEEMRAQMESLLASLPKVDGVSTEPVDAAGIPAEWTVPQDREVRGTILYLHGGGYYEGSVSTHRRLVAALCLAAGARGLSVDYRLAPENRFPAAVEDAVAAYRWLTSDGVEEPASVVVAGDSAGGGLTFATLIALRDAGDAMPAGAFGISPWTDLAAIGESLVTRKDRDPYIDPTSIAETVRRYVDDSQRRNPLASPLYGNLTGLPPLLIHVGGAEVLYDDAARMAAAAREAGVEVEFADWPDAFHVWHMMAGLLPEADEAVSAAGAWIAKRLASARI